jgi:hypothetical protein
VMPPASQFSMVSSNKKRKLGSGGANRPDPVEELMQKASDMYIMKTREYNPVISSYKSNITRYNDT